MRHSTPLSKEHLDKLKASKAHWDGGAPPVSLDGVKRMDFTPLVVKPHPQQERIDSFRAIKSLVL